jgi:DNA-binding HxlR family transcriptional regulator
MTKVEDCIKEIPEELRTAIKALASDYRLAIFVTLRRHEELSFSDVQGELGIDKGMLNYHFKKLTQSGLVHHYFKHELGAEQYSFYALTQFGQSFFENLQSFLEPTGTAFATPFDTGLRRREYANCADFLMNLSAGRGILRIVCDVSGIHNVKTDLDAASEVVGLVVSPMDLLSDRYVVCQDLHAFTKFDANSGSERIREKTVMPVRSLSQ